MGQQSHNPIPGVARARPIARRWQQSIALAVVALPIIGVVAAVALWWRVGIGALELGALAGMFFVCMLGVTVGFHRHFAHNSFKTSRAGRALLIVLGSMAAQGPVLFWVVTHRRHHAFSDQEGDPHSPNLHGGDWTGLLVGLWHSHIGWMFSDELTDWVHFGRDLLQDRMIFRLHRLYALWVMLGLVLPAAVCGLIGGTWLAALQGLLWGGLVRMFMVNQASWCVGSVCHVFGTRPFQTRDRSANNYLVALLTFGEGLQNNHHAFPSSHAHAVWWWEPDLSAWVIRMLEFCGLVWDVKRPTARAVSELRAVPSVASELELNRGANG
ncbi:MAG TPA: acyl-CoA desaturase [Pirellulales bacterium]|jgi:stearoyl-CoA desaturase (delta-9 desaturase)|nr:acyl-CoA desaturase [Pirellulales bacterium]